MVLASDNIERTGLIAAVDQAADAIVISGTDGKIQYVNPAFTVLTGYSSDEALGRNPRFLKSGRHPLSTYQDLWSTIQAGKTRFTCSSSSINVGIYGSWSDCHGFPKFGQDSW